MVFSSESFLFLFLPLFLAAYYLTPTRLKSYTILAGSYVFYAWWRVDFLGLLFLTTAFAYVVGQQVAKLRVAVLVLAEVRPDTGEELVDADPGCQLLEHRPALRVGDAVEVHLNVFEVADLGDDGVGGGELVLAVGPGLLHRIERRPGLGPLGGLGRRNRRSPLGERLVEPEIVPPLHGDEVTEPHVGKLVEDRDDAALLDGIRHLAAEDVHLGEGDCSRILHGSGVIGGGLAIRLQHHADGALLAGEEHVRPGAPSAGRTKKRGDSKRLALWNPSPTSVYSRV